MDRMNASRDLEAKMGLKLGPKVRRDATPDELQALVGRRIVKASGKPFKSQLLIGTVAGISPLPYKSRDGVAPWAFRFVEDDSVVECCICRPIEE